MAGGGEGALLWHLCPTSMREWRVPAKWSKHPPRSARQLRRRAASSTGTVLRGGTGFRCLSEED